MSTADGVEFRRGRPREHSEAEGKGFAGDEPKFQRAGERVSGDGKEFQVRSERGLGSVMWGLDSQGREKPESPGSGRMDISRDKGHDGLCPGGHKADNEESAGRALESSPGVVSQRAGPSAGHCLMVAVLKGHTVK